MEKPAGQYWTLCHSKLIHAEPEKRLLLSREMAAILHTVLPANGADCARLLILIGKSTWVQSGR